MSETSIKEPKTYTSNVRGMDRSVDARRKANDISPHRQCGSVCYETIGWRMGSSTPDYGRKIGYWIDTDHIENENKGSMKDENYERKQPHAVKHLPRILNLYLRQNISSLVFSYKIREIEM